MSIVFKDVSVYHQTRGGTVVSWRLASGPPGDLRFRVWCSDSGIAAWRLVGTVTGALSLIDVQRRQYATDVRVAYRVEAVDGDTSVMSGVTYAGIQLGDKHALVASAILKKERMLLEKRTGTPGLLWKRKHWGPRCGTCLDPDSGEPRDSHCPECYATGISGGYYPAVDYLFALGPARARKLTESQQGMVNPQQLAGRGLPCPRLDTGDVWATCATDERYVVGAIRETLFQGAVLLYEQVELGLAPAADVVYRLPTSDEGQQAGEVLVEGGRLLVYDGGLDAFYPVGIDEQALAVLPAPEVNFRMVGSRLHLRDARSGQFYAVGLRGGAFEVYASGTDAPAADITHGYLRFWDPEENAYRRAGLSYGVFEVYEEAGV